MVPLQSEGLPSFMDLQQGKVGVESKETEEWRIPQISKSNSGLEIIRDPAEILIKTLPDRKCHVLRHLDCIRGLKHLRRTNWGARARRPGDSRTTSGLLRSRGCALGSIRAFEYSRGCDADQSDRKSGQGQVRSPFKRIQAHVFLAHNKRHPPTGERIAQSRRSARTAASDGRADSAVTTLRSAKPNSAAILQSLPRRKVSLESACMSHGPNLGCRIIAGIWCRFSRTDFPPSWICDRAKLVSNR